MVFLLFVKEKVDNCFVGSGGRGFRLTCITLRFCPYPLYSYLLRLICRLDTVDVKGAVFHATTIINVVNADSNTFCATCFGGENIFDSANLKHTHLVRGDSGCSGVVVNNSLASKSRSQLDRVRRGNLFFFLVQKAGNLNFME